jgi:hypothetical protein
MGLLVEQLRSQLGITDPVESVVDHLVPAAVSNWGAYGIVAYLGRLAGRDLLPGHAEDTQALNLMLALGAIDGLTRRPEPTVDGFSLAATAALLRALRSVPAPVEPAVPTPLVTKS